MGLGWADSYLKPEKPDYPEIRQRGKLKSEQYGGQVWSSCTPYWPADPNDPNEIQKKYIK